MYKTARIVLMMLLLSRSAYGSDGSSLPSGARLQFATVHTPEDVEFVREQLVKYLYVGVLEPAEWDRALQAGEVKIAHADLNDDDSPEIFVMVENSLCCGSLGCRGILLQKLRGRWRLMDNPYFSGNTMIMTEKKFSYHKLYTADRIHTFRNGKTYEILSLEDGRIIGSRFGLVLPRRPWNGDCKPTKLQLSRPFCHSFVRFGPASSAAVQHRARLSEL